MLNFCCQNPQCTRQQKPAAWNVRAERDSLADDSITGRWGRRAALFAILSGLLLTVAVAGCKPKAHDNPADDIIVVPVSHPVNRDVTDYADFTGRTDAQYSVSVIARVTGYLEAPKFAEGSEVNKGDLLFVIDPRPYEAQYEQAKSQVTLNEAQRDLAQKTLVRFQALAKSQPGSVSEQALDQYQASVVEADARVAAQNKSLDVYKLNKEFTHVVSPISGQVSRYYLTEGNLVNQDQTLLTTVVSLDPMYVYFDMDEATRLRIVKAIQEGKITVPAEGGMPIWLGLQNEEGFPHRATLNFINNQINSTTGSITLRGVFENKKLASTGKASSSAGSGSVPGAASDKAPGTAPDKAASAVPDKTPNAAGGKVAAVENLLAVKKALTPGAAGTVKFDRQFAPGMFVRVRFPMGEKYPALLVIDRAIQSDQGLKFVYVVDADNKVQTRSIKTGALQEDGLRVVEEGLKPDDAVIVGAIQQVRPLMVVKPEARTMPTNNGPSEPVPPAAGQAKDSSRAKTESAPRTSAPVAAPQSSGQAKGTAKL